MFSALIPSATFSPPRAVSHLHPGLGMPAPTLGKSPHLLSATSTLLTPGLLGCHPEGSGMLQWAQTHR